MSDVKYRIDNSTAFFMAMVCLFFDTIGLVGLILIVGTALNWVVWLFAQGTFYLWMRKYDVALFVDKKGTPSIKNILATIVTAIVEFFLGFLPAISLQIGIIVSTSWAQDLVTAKTGVDVGGKKPQTQVPAQEETRPEPRKVPTI